MTQIPRPGPRWIAPTAIAGALLGNWLLYGITPGINWVLCTTTAALGVAFVSWRRHGSAGRPVYVLLAIALAVVAGTPMTTDPATHAIIAGIVIWTLGTAMLLAAAPDLQAVRLGLLIRVPRDAPLAALRATSDELHDRVHWARSTEAKPVLRGTLFTLPCIVVLGLLLSAADPTFASWRDAIATYVPHVDAPEIVLTVALGLALLGGWRHAALATDLPTIPSSPRFPIPRLGRTEYRLALSSVTALLALFIALQIASLFGGAARLDGTGVTYAEYAHRGYAQLSIVAAIVMSLVLLAERDRTREWDDATIHGMQYALLGMVVIILASALHRITLYEDAYGYTVLRLHARVFAGLLLCAVVCVAWQLWRGLDVGQLSRQLIAAGLLAVIGLTWWNDQAWIASRNLARATPGAARVPLDAQYLLTLSDDVNPTLAGAVSMLPNTLHARALNKIAGVLGPEPWYAWNYRRTQARAAAQALARLRPMEHEPQPPVETPGAESSS